MSVTINGTTGITTPKVDSAGGITGTPCFSAYQPSGTNIAASVWTKVQLSVEEFDTANAFDSTTNYRFQPVVAGYYHFNGGISISGTTMTLGDIALYKNGAIYKSHWTVPYSSLNAGFGISDLIYLNGTSDYVELWGRVTAASAQLINGSQSQTRLTGFLVRAA